MSLELIGHLLLGERSLKKERAQLNKALLADAHQIGVKMVPMMLSDPPWKAVRKRWLPLFGCFAAAHLTDRRSIFLHAERLAWDVARDSALVPLPA